jgi:hypothetical protein
MKPLKRFVRLDRTRHERRHFDCGKAPLNEFLARHACRGMDARASHTWVLPAAGTPREEKKPVCAYYTLSVCHIERESLSNDLAKRMPRYPLPVIPVAHGFSVQRSASFAFQGKASRRVIAGPMARSDNAAMGHEGRAQRPKIRV